MRYDKFDDDLEGDQACGKREKKKEKRREKRENKVYHQVKITKQNKNKK